jgi:hypothetical protein
MTTASYWTCQGCGTTHSTADPDMITGHVGDCDYVDGAGQPVDLTIKFSAVHWYITRVRSDRLAQVTGGRPFTELRGPVDDDDDSDLEEFLSEQADEAGSAMADGFEVGDVYPATLDERPGSGGLPQKLSPQQPGKGPAGWPGLSRMPARRRSPRARSGQRRRLTA